VGQSVKILVTNGGQILKVHTPVGILGGTLATVDCDFMAARGQTRKKLFGESFKTAIPGWDAARAE
jgi:hypothetical protein